MRRKTVVVILHGLEKLHDTLELMASKVWID